MSYPTFPVMPIYSPCRVLYSPIISLLINSSSRKSKVLTYKSLAYKIKLKQKFSVITSTTSGICQRKEPGQGPVHYNFYVTSTVPSTGAISTNWCGFRFAYQDRDPFEECLSKSFVGLKSVGNVKWGFRKLRALRSRKIDVKTSVVSFLLADKFWTL